jgi:hypothetical protein
MPPYPAVDIFKQLYSHVMPWSGKKMKELTCMTVPVLALTLLKLSASKKIPVKEALVGAEYFAYHYHMVQNWYHTEATIEYMGNSSG